MRKNNGFTLAEVLITLGIIGVVAALTIPTLISNTNSRRFASQFKKSLSTIKQAILLGEANYDVALSNLNATCGTNGATDRIEDMTICGLFNATLAGATFIPQSTISREREVYRGISTCGINTYAIGYSMADGSSFYITQESTSCTKETPCCAFIDVNGKNNPNKEVSGVEVTSYNNLIMPAAYAQDLSEDAQIYVPEDSQHMTDVYPIYLYDQEVVPATAAAAYVLTGVTKKDHSESHRGI